MSRLREFFNSGAAELLLAFCFVLAIPLAVALHIYVDAELAEKQRNFEIKCLNLGGVPMETPHGNQVCAANVPTIEVKP